MDVNIEEMDFEDKVDYLIENLDQIPDDLLDRAVTILVEAGEIDIAAALARDRGQVNRAIEILVEAGDYLWAALMAKNAGMEEESKQLYRQGLGFYVDRGMFGRAVAAATALNLPHDEIEALFIKGVETETQYLDPEQARAMVSELVPDLEISLACWSQEASEDAVSALRDYRARLMEGEAIDWPKVTEGSQSSESSSQSGSGREVSGSAAPLRSDSKSSKSSRGIPVTPQSSSSASTSRGASSKGEEEYARWRGGSDRGMRSADGTGRLSYLDSTGTGKK